MAHTINAIRAVAAIFGNRHDCPPFDSPCLKSCSLLRRFLDVSRAISPRRGETFWTAALWRLTAEHGYRCRSLGFISGAKMRFAIAGCDTATDGAYRATARGRMLPRS